MKAINESPVTNKIVDNWSNYVASCQLNDMTIGVAVFVENLSQLYESGTTE